MISMFLNSMSPSIGFPGGLTLSEDIDIDGVLMPSLIILHFAAPSLAGYL